MVVGGSHRGLKDTVIQGPPFCCPDSPLLSSGQPAALPYPSSSSWAFDQSWPLCHSCPSGGSSPSPTTTLPAGRPSLMNTYGCKHTGAYREPTHRLTPPHMSQKLLLISKETTSRMTEKTGISLHACEQTKDGTTSMCEKGVRVSLCLCGYVSVLRFAWVHKFTQVHMCFCQVKETGNVIQSACYASTEQTHYALGAAFSTYKQTPELTNITACLHMKPCT